MKPEGFIIRKRVLISKGFLRNDRKIVFRSSQEIFLLMIDRALNDKIILFPLTNF